MSQSREGIVKFHCQWQECEADPAWPVAMLNSIRTPLYLRKLVGVDQEGIGYGNISLRIPDTDEFVITGTQTGGLPTLQPRHVTRVTGFDLPGNRLDCQGPIRASSESMSHAVVYRKCPSVRSVVHVHHAGMWSRYRNCLPTTPEGAAYGTPEMALSIETLLEDQRTLEKGALVMGGHDMGLLFFAPTGERILEVIAACFQPWEQA